MAIIRSDFGQTTSGEPVYKFTLQNSSKVVVSILNLGGIVHEIFAPDKDGNIADIVLGYDDVPSYERSQTYYGALIGRFGNRINQGRFSLGGKAYQLETNNGPNHLHGGFHGFDKRIWESQQIDDATLELRLFSKEGDQGYPGNLSVKVTYHLSDDGSLSVRYNAQSDAMTILNLTQHSYFNLSGHLDSSILDHVIQINAQHITEIDAALIPTGNVLNIANTAFDFRKPKRLGEVIDTVDRQLSFGGGFDHNYVLDNNTSAALPFAASAYHPDTGRRVMVYSDRPAMQFYTGNFITGEELGKSGVKYPYRSGLCFETQGFPDAPNHPNFPSVVLEKDTEFSTETQFHFLTDQAQL